MAIRSGKPSLQSIDPFNDIAPLADSLSEGNPGNFVQLSHDFGEGYVNEQDENESEDDEDTEWGLEDDFSRNAFDDFIIDDGQQNRALCNQVISLTFCFLKLLYCLRRKIIVKKNIKFWTYCLDKKIKNSVVREIKFP